MQPLYKVLDFTSEFKYDGDTWVVIHDGDDEFSTVARNRRTQYVEVFSIYCLVEPVGTDTAIIERQDNRKLEETIRIHAKKHGWPNVAKAMRAIVFVHVGWDSAFTELDNILHRIERGNV